MFSVSMFESTKYKHMHFHQYLSQKTKLKNTSVLLSSWFFPLVQSPLSFFSMFVCIFTWMCRYVVLCLHVFSCVRVWVAECHNVLTSHAMCINMHVCKYDECILLCLIKCNI